VIGPEVVRTSELRDAIAGLLGARPRVVATRPFRAPHHTASRASIVVGGAPKMKVSR